MSKADKNALVPGWPLPECEPTTPEQEELITKLIGIVFPPDAERSGFWKVYDDADLRIMVCKYLVARKWVLADAEKMLRDTIDFKQQRGLNTWAVFPAAFRIRGWDETAVNEFFGKPPRERNDFDRTFDLISPHYHMTYHKWDKLNHPVFLEQTGRTNVRKLVENFKKVTPVGKPYTQPCVDYHIHVNEVGGHLMRFQDKTVGARDGRRVLGVLVVLDLEGLGYSSLYKPALELLKASWGIDSQYYPEGMHKLFAVNCPGMTMFAFNIVKGWLDERVRNKVQFVSPSKTKEVLLSVIDAENLPEYLGGTCHCEGGCVFESPMVDASSPALDASPDEVLTEEVRVPAGKVELREFPMLAGEEVAWEYCVPAMNVEFSVKFVPSAPHEAGAEKMVLEKEKSNNGTGAFTASEPGTLILAWDNTYSWMNAKTLSLRAFKVRV